MRFNMLHRLIFLISIVSIVLSCAPQSKEAYLESYKAFLAEINTNSNSYSEIDWKEKDEEFIKYKDEWKEKFNDEFTYKEKAILMANEVKYNYYKMKPPINNIFKDFVKEDYEKIKEQLQNYKEREMDEDIEEVIKQAEEVGDEAVKALDEIFKELNLELEKYQNDK